MIAAWDDMPFLLSLARVGTLSGAARALKVDRTTVSRRIEQLEDTLKEPLFDRFNGRFILTTYGHKVFTAAQKAEQELLFLGRRDIDPSDYGGKIRVSLPDHLLLAMTDCFQAFVIAHPNIRLELSATDRVVDLNHFEADVALRISRSSQGDLLTKRIGTPIWGLYRGLGADTDPQRYIARPGENPVPKYISKIAPHAVPGMAVDGLVSVREFIASGFGVGVLPRYLGDPDPRIQRCSGDLGGTEYALFIAYRPEQRHLRRIKIFVAHIQQSLQAMDGFDDASPTAHKDKSIV